MDKHTVDMPEHVALEDSPEKKAARKKLYFYGTLSFIFGLLLMVGGVILAGSIGILANKLLVRQGLTGTVLHLAGIPVVLLTTLLFWPGIILGWKARKLAVGLQDFTSLPKPLVGAPGAAAFSPTTAKLWLGYFGLVWCSLDLLIGVLFALFGYYIANTM